MCPAVVPPDPDGDQDLETKATVFVFQYFCSLLVVFCVELASAVWTYDEVRQSFLSLRSIKTVRLFLSYLCCIRGQSAVPKTADTK